MVQRKRASALPTTGSASVTMCIDSLILAVSPFGLPQADARLLRLSDDASSTRSGTLLWAITSYFNPCGYKARLANYRLFREHLNVPLVTVEASHNGTFELDTRDAEVLVQRHARDVLWQKERLLNIALESLPPECSDVAWLDCDVVFDSDDWPERTSAALETYSLVQLFSERCRLDREGSTDPPNRHRIEHVQPGAGAKIAAGTAAPEDLYKRNVQRAYNAGAGFAWAARKAALGGHGFYDACI